MANFNPTQPHSSATRETTRAVMRACFCRCLRTSQTFLAKAKLQTVLDADLRTWTVHLHRKGPQYQAGICALFIDH